MPISTGWLNKVQLPLTVKYDNAMHNQKSLPRHILKVEKNQGAEMHKECVLCGYKCVCVRERD